MDPTVSFGDWVRRRRKMLDMTQVDLARKVSCSPSMLRKIEHDERRPSEQLAELLAGELAIDDAQRPLFLQMARGRYVPDMPGPGEISFDHLAAQDSAFRTPHSTRQNLPAQTKPFIGRESELRRLDGFFADPDIRLVTILGPGGMGKTELAIEWARRLADADSEQDLSDGVHFVDLAPLENAEQVAPAMAEVLDFPLQGARRSPEQQIIDYLRQKQLCLILDNFEQLLGGAPFVNEILQTALAIFVLVTSRERLRLSIEQIIVLEGLSCPADLDQLGDDEDIESFAAVQLFFRSAQRLRPGYRPAPEDYQAIGRICRATAGMPLAIELAASWIDLLPVSKIAREIEGRLDVLESDMRDVPERHRSIRAVIDTITSHGAGGGHGQHGHIPRGSRPYQVRANSI